jgi:hypothetical protein
VVAFVSLEPLSDGVSADDPAWVLQRRQTALDRLRQTSPAFACVFMTQQDGCLGLLPSGGCLNDAFRRCAVPHPVIPVRNCND